MFVRLFILYIVRVHTKIQNIFFDLFFTCKFGKRTFRQKQIETFRQIFMPNRPVLSWFCFWFSTKWLGPVCIVPVCRILELKKNDNTINVGMMQSMKRASDMSPFPLVPRSPLGRLIFPSCLARSNRSKDLAGTEIAKQS